MISNLSLAIFACALLIILIFIGWSLKNERKRPLLHKLYLALMLAYVSWVIPLMCMRLVAPSNTSMMFFLDCMTAPGGSLCSPIYLCIAVSFVEGYERMQKWMKGLFVLPLISILVTWTNPLHHLQYVKFSVVRSEIVFGPYVLISGAINYCILIGAVVYMIRFVLKNKSALYWKQCILFTLSGLCPLAMSAYATFSGKEVPITLVGDAMVALSLTEGDHEIEFTYRNRAFSAGLAVSLVCLAVFLTLAYLQNRTWCDANLLQLKAFLKRK